MFDFYAVGGSVRDEIMGVKSKDRDYTAVPTELLLSKTRNVIEVFDMLLMYLSDQGFKIYKDYPEKYTVLAKFPPGYEFEGDADFVLSRKEIGYEEDTRNPILTLGTLYDDLLRRDFTVNAIAKDKHGNYIDPFNGIQDIKDNILKTPIDCRKTFKDDPLRVLRAIRFHITKGFKLSRDIMDYITHLDVTENGLKGVSTERIREELHRCFKFSSIETMFFLTYKCPHLAVFSFKTAGLWLKPTTEK